MKNIFLPLFLIVAFSGLTQNQNTTEDFPNAKASYLTFDLATPIDPIAPRYRFGYIQSLSKNWRIGADLGYGSENTTVRLYDIDESDNYRLLEARIEGYHIFNPTRKVNHYISGEVYLVNHREDIEHDYYNIKNRDIRIRYDYGEYQREKYGVNLKYGVMIPFGSKVGMNIYVGAGPSTRNITFTNLVNAEEIEYYDNDDDWEFFEGHYRNEGRRTSVHFAFGFKFFYRLK